MNKNAKLLLIAMLILCLTAFAAACAPAEEVPASDTDASATDAADYNLLEDGVLTVAMVTGFAPFSYADENGEIVGTDRDIIDAVVARLGLELKILPMSFDGMLEKLSRHEFDAAICDITIKEDRKELVDFSKPYAAGDMVAVCKAGSGYTIDTLIEAAHNGEATIGMEGYAACVGRVEEIFSKESVKYFDDERAAAEAMVNDEITAFVINSASFSEAMDSYGLNNEVMSLVLPDCAEEFAIAVCKDCPALLDAINDALTDMGI